MEYEVEGSRPRGRPKRTWRKVVEKDCQASKLNKEDAIHCSRWRKLIKDVWWSGWVWVGGCFFSYWPTWYWLVSDKGPLNGCLCVCLSSLLLPHYFVIKIKRKQQIPRQILEAKANTRNTFGNCIWACLELPFVNILHHEAEQEAQLSPRDCAMRRVNWNLANCHATVQRLLIRQVLTKSMVWSWRFSRRQCVIDNVHSTMTLSSRLPLSQVS